MVTMVFYIALLIILVIYYIHSVLYLPDYVTLKSRSKLNGPKKSLSLWRNIYHPFPSYCLNTPINRGVKTILYHDSFDPKGQTHSIGTRSANLLHRPNI